MVLPDGDHTADHRPELSVVLCTRNGAETIDQQLDALAAQRTTITWELVVIDNGSTDNTVAVVDAHSVGEISVRIVDAHEHQGLSFARNVGVANALADRVAFCDDDDIVSLSWVQAMHDALTDHRLVASAMEYDRLNAAATIVGRSRFQSERIESLLGMPVCSGACGVSKDLWQSIGGNDETMNSTGEDFDFAMRAQRVAGANPYFAKDAVYHYRQRSDSRSTYRQAKAHGASHAHLWSKHRDRRLPPTVDLKRAAKDWWWIITRAPIAMAGHNKSLWMRKTGKRLGRINGSLKHRVFLP